MDDFMNKTPKELEEIELESWALPWEERVAISIEIRIARTVPRRYRESRLPDIGDPRYVYWQKIRGGASGLIVGPNGTGKSWFLWACWKELARQNRGVVLCRDAIELSDEINHEVVENRVMLRSLLEDEYSFPTLLIDELDKLRPTDASFQNIKELIGFRYDHGLQTVAVGNGTLETADRVTSQYVYSRLTGEADGNFKAFFGGNDLRRKR